MFKKLDIRINIRNGILAGIGFALSVLFYIREVDYADTWIVYVGSFVFFIVVFFDILLYNRRHGKNANSITMAFSSHVTTMIGVLVSCILSFVLLTIMVPGYLSNSPAEIVSTDTPVNAIHDKTNGLSWRIFIGATIFNFSFGSFAGLMFPFAVKRNQKEERGDSFPLQDKSPGL